MTRRRRRARQIVSGRSLRLGLAAAPPEAQKLLARGRMYRDTTRALELRLAALHQRRAELSVEIAETQAALDAQRPPSPSPTRWLRWSSGLAFAGVAAAATLLAILPRIGDEHADEIEVTRDNAHTLRFVASVYVESATSPICPTPAQLLRGGWFADRAQLFDGEGHELHVECRGEAIVVHADGPGYHYDTEEDSLIRVEGLRASSTWR